MALNFALFITHPDPEYLTFTPEFVNAELGTTGYNSTYMDTITELGAEMAQEVIADNTDGQFILHSEDPTVCVIERKWASLEACQAWMQKVLAIHTATGAPAPTTAKVVNLTTLEETIIYPT